jgi:hypothetical protein
MPNLGRDTSLAAAAGASAPGLPFLIALALLVLCCVAMAAPAPAAAQTAPPQPGPLFRLSSCANCTQHGPTVAGNASGDFMAAWDGVQNLVQQDVFGRFFGSADAPVDADFDLQSSPVPLPPQFDASAAADAQGNFVVAWATLAGDQSQILVQRYDAKGNLVGPLIEAASDPSPSPSDPADFNPVVAGAPGGGFVVAWIALPAGNTTGKPLRVMLRSFDAAGAPAGAAIQVSTSLPLGDRPSLCVSGTGRIHAAWTVADGLHPFEPTRAGVVVRRLTPAGVPLAGEQLVAPPVASESSTAVACGPGNTYMVAWETDQPPATSGSDIVAQHFTRLGRAVGAPFLVNQAIGQHQKDPAIYHDPTGAYVIVWQGTPGGVNGVRGRRYADSGAPLSDEFAVYRAGLGDVTVLRPAVAGVGTGGDFVVAVDAPGGVVGRVFKPRSENGANAADAAALAEAGGASTGNGTGAGGLW